MVDAALTYATWDRHPTAMPLAHRTRGRRDFWQRNINQMRGQFDLSGIFRWTLVADQLRAPACQPRYQGHVRYPPKLTQ
jgi:hypothetical protein